MGRVVPSTSTSTTDPRPPGTDEAQPTWLSRGRRRLEGWRAGRRPSRDRVVLLCGALVAVALAAWLTSGGWGGRPMAGDDSMAHVIRARFAFRHLVSNFRVDGWDPSFILGYQAFLLIGAGFTWMVSLLHALSLGSLSITGAVKVVSLGSFVVAPLAVAFLARSFGLSGRSAGLAAILSLAVNSPFGGVGLQGMFNVGLLTHQFAGPLFFLALGGAVRILRGDRRRWIVFTALTTAALLVTHGISVIVFGAMFGVVLVTVWLPVPSIRRWREARAAVIRQAVREELHRLGFLAEAEPAQPAEAATIAAPDRPSRQTLHNLFAAFAVAGGLAAFALLPFWGHRNLRGIFTAWATPPLGDRLAEIWEGRILYQPRVAILVLAGLAYGVYRATEGKRLAIPLVATPLAYVVGSHVAFHLWPASVVTPQLTNRGIGYAGVLAILPLAALIARATRGLGLPGDGLALAVAAGIVLVPVTPYRAFAKQANEPIPQLREAAAQLRRVVPEDARFVTQRDFPEEISRTRVVNPDRWLAWASGRYTLNNFNVESSQTPGPAYEGEHILDRSPEAIADSLSRLGTTHLVTVSDPGAEHVGGSARFVPVWRSSPIAVFAVVPPAGHPDPGALLSAATPVGARLVEATPEHIVIDVSTDQAVAATVAVGWSPKWRARIDGRPALRGKSEQGMLGLALPSGQHRVELDFRSDFWDYAGMATTLGTIAWGLRWLVRSGRRRQRTPEPEPAPAEG